MGEHHTVGAFRACRHGDGIEYRTTLEASGPQAVAAIPSGLENGHYINQRNHPGRYAVLDVLDVNGSVLDTRDIPDVIAFDKMRETLGFRVVSTDCGLGCG